MQLTEQKTKRNVKERSIWTVIQAVAAGGLVEGIEAAVPWLEAGDYATAGKVALFVVLIGALSALKNFVENRLPDRSESIVVED